MRVNSLGIDMLGKIRIQDKFWMYPDKSLPVGVLLQTGRRKLLMKTAKT